MVMMKTIHEHHPAHVDRPQYTGGMIAAGQRAHGGVPGSFSVWGCHKVKMWFVCRLRHDF